MRSGQGSTLTKKREKHEMKASRRAQATRNETSLLSAFLLVPFFDVMSGEQGDIVWQ